MIAILILLALQVATGESQTCPTWTTLPGQISNNPVHQPTVRTQQDCSVACVNNAACVAYAIATSTSSTSVVCYLILSQSDLSKLTTSTGVTQFNINRCQPPPAISCTPGCQTCTATACTLCANGYNLVNGACSSSSACPTWTTLPGQISNNPVHQPTVRTQQDCSAACISNAACVAYATASSTSSTSVVCYLILSQSDLSKLTTSTGVTQYNINRCQPPPAQSCSTGCQTCTATACTSCANGYNLVNGACSSSSACPTWTTLPGQISDNPVQQPTVHTPQDCSAACINNQACVAYATASSTSSTTVICYLILSRSDLAHMTTSTGVTQYNINRCQQPPIACSSFPNCAVCTATQCTQCVGAYVLTGSVCAGAWSAWTFSSCSATTCGADAHITRTRTCTTNPNTACVGMSKAETACSPAPPKCTTACPSSWTAMTPGTMGANPLLRPLLTTLATCQAGCDDVPSCVAVTMVNSNMCYHILNAADLATPSQVQNAVQYQITRCACSANCQSCSSATTCTTCNTQYNLQNGNCVVPVNGNWGAWSVGACSVTCGPGTQTLTRVCSTPSAGGLPCAGSASSSAQCNLQPCPAPRIDGGWSSWITSSGCSVTCGQNGQVTQTRSCTNPSPQNGGVDCQGSMYNYVPCQPVLPNCPMVNGGWSSWINGPCTVTCGSNGQIMQTRSCTNPPAQNGGMDCYGSSYNYMPCTSVLPNCPVPDVPYQVQIILCNQKNLNISTSNPAYINNFQLAIAQAAGITANRVTGVTVAQQLPNGILVVRATLLTATGTNLLSVSAGVGNLYNQVMGLIFSVTDMYSNTLLVCPNLQQSFSAWPLATVPNPNGGAYPVFPTWPVTLPPQQTVMQQAACGLVGVASPTSNVYVQIPFTNQFGSTVLVDPTTYSAALQPIIARRCGVTNSRVTNVVVMQDQRTGAMAVQFTLLPAQVNTGDTPSFLVVNYLCQLAASNSLTFSDPYSANPLVVSNAYSMSVYAWMDSSPCLTMTCAAGYTCQSIAVGVLQCVDPVASPTTAVRYPWWWWILVVVLPVIIILLIIILIILFCCCRDRCTCPTTTSQVATRRQECPRIHVNTITTDEPPRLHNDYIRSARRYSSKLPTKQLVGQPLTINVKEYK